MKTNILTHVRQYRGEYWAGRRFAGRIHIYTSTRSLIRQLRSKIVNREHRFGPQFKSTRLAYYAGAMMAHRQERRLCVALRM